MKLMDPKKPWEETWGWQAAHSSMQSGWVTTPHGGSVGVFYKPGSSFEDAEARGRLAAAAPDMARVLLAIEWGVDRAEYGGACPSCDCFNPDGDAPLGYAKGHEPACALDAALRKAGVR